MAINTNNPFEVPPMEPGAQQPSRDVRTPPAATPASLPNVTYFQPTDGVGAVQVPKGASATPTPSPSPSPAPSTITPVSFPANISLQYPINAMGDSTVFGVAAPAGSDPVTQLRAKFLAGASFAFNLQGTATNVPAQVAGQGGAGGENSAQGLARAQYVATNFPAQMARTWVYSFGLNDYLPSVTPQTRQWADNVAVNAASLVALVPPANDTIFLLTPAEQNVGPGQQFAADHAFHRRDMRSKFGWRAVDKVRALRLIRQEDSSQPILSGGGDEKALSMGIMPYSYRGTGTYGTIVNGTDYPDGDRIPTINAAAPSNTTDLAFDPGLLWYHNNGASPAMYRKTGANGAGGWALSDTKHDGRVGYGKVADILAWAAAASEAKGPPFAPPQELRVSVGAGAGAVLGTLDMKGTPTVAGIYDMADNLFPQLTISLSGVITRVGTAPLPEGHTELKVALTNALGTLHSALDLYVVRAAGEAPSLRPLAAPGAAIVGRANHGMANTTGFSFALYLSVSVLTSAPSLMIFTRNPNLASSPSTPSTPVNITLTTGGAPRFTVVDSTNATIAASLITTGASLSAATPGWLFVSLDFTNNLRTVFVADAASERQGTVGAITAGTVPLNDALPTFLMGAAPTQYYDGVTPLAGGIGYIGFWDTYVDWTIAANRRALCAVDGTPAVRTPYSALPSAPAPKLELFGRKGDWLYGTPDGSNGPQTLSMSYRARALMS